MRNCANVRNYLQNLAVIRWQQDFPCGSKCRDFQEKINACCGLTEEDFIPKIKIDIPMPVDYPDIPLVNELLLLEPFGKANVKPQFADKNLGIDRAVVVGKNQNVLKLTLKTERGKSISAVYFGDVEEFGNIMEENMGKMKCSRHSLAGQMESGCLWYIIPR